MRRKGGGPGDGNDTQQKWLGRDHAHPSGAFRPTCLDGEVFGMNTVRARSLECLYTPLDGLLHGRRAGNASADLVGQLLQVGVEGRGLKGFGDYPIGCVLGEGGAQQDGEKKSAQQGSWHKAELEMKLVKRAKR